MTFQSAIRWGDNDRYFGPFTYARATKAGSDYRPLAVVLCSGDGDDYPGCNLRLSGFGHTLIIALPAIIKPWSRFVTMAQSIHGGYHDQFAREYGFSLSDGFLQVFLGPQTHDSWTTKNWCAHLPWTQWRHVRRSVYDQDGAHFYTVPEKTRWSDYADKIDACPVRTFTFTDYDDELLTAKTRIEEREWRFGEGWFKWLSIFRRPRIRRSLDIQFSGETGERKGGWKGGVTGHSIEMLPGELHESAFRRYCAQHNMTLIAEALSS